MKRDVIIIDPDDEAEIRRRRRTSRKRPRATTEVGSRQFSTENASEQVETGSSVSNKLARLGVQRTAEIPGINDLSDDLLVQIFQHLGGLLELMRVLPVCKRWLRVGGDPRLWSTLSFYNYEHVSDAALRSILANGQALRRLKSLSLAKCHRISEDTVRLIPKSPCVNSLESIDLSWCSGASSRSVPIFSRCPGLKEVRLSYCWKVHGRALKCLALRCPRLEVLDINCCTNVRDSHIIAFAEHCRNLRYLNIANARSVSDRAICRLAERCQNLEVLDLSWCSKITDVSLNAIAANLPKLRELRLNETQVSNLGLCQVVKSCKQLEELHLARCAIGVFAAASIALHCRTNLKILNLACCEAIPDRAVLAILSCCISLRSLDVSTLPCRRIGSVVESLSGQTIVYY
uniref:F-box domain-containing protein n=1 Tax=Rhodosorus marinus TaxID=101924 RepID=A0A7S2ZFX3_9RHOD|mmetsp:Transcript_18233/g.73042  ORF Transcript_18233/g.73042 Transcript_18233/m.73042 type:complete len:404 (+) Transcript_18233:272-1483(+)